MRRGRKILNMRLFENADTGKAWDRSVMDMGLEVLLVSQFTLYGILKGESRAHRRAPLQCVWVDHQRALVLQIGVRTGREASLIVRTGGHSGEIQRAQGAELMR